MAINANARSGRINLPTDGQVITNPGRELSTADTNVKPDAITGSESPPLDSNQVLIQIDNDNPQKSSMYEVGRLGLWRKLLKRLKALLTRTYTPEQIAVMDEKKQRELLDKTLKSDAVLAEKRMINALTRLGICYETTHNGNKKLRTVKFSDVGYEPNAIWLRIDTDHLPHLVNVEEFKQKSTIDNMGFACRHAVSCEWSTEKGVWYVMERASGAMGIPSRVAWAAMYDRMPASIDHLAFPIGLTINNRPVFESLNTCVHWLVAGGSGFGKSVFLNNLLCTLIKRNNPNQLRIAMVDLKGGNTFQFYRGLPHLLTVDVIAEDGVCTKRDDVFKLLDYIVDESEKRMSIFSKAEVTDIGEYNRHRRNHRMADWVLVIDEWADVFLGTKSKEAQLKLVNIAQRCRSVGIHLIVCTQVAKSSILDTMITANLPGRIVFHFPNFQGSRAALDDGRAHGLKVKGRAIAITSTEDLTVQTPYISNDMVKAIVDFVVNNKDLEINRQHDVTQSEVQEWALKTQSGWLKQRNVIAEFSPRGITRAELLGWLKSWDNQEYLINGALYRCVPGSGSTGRRLIAVIDDESNQKGDTDE